MFAEFIRFYLVWLFITIIFLFPIFIYLIVKYLSENHNFYTYEDEVKYYGIIKNEDSDSEKEAVADVLFIWWFEKQKRKEKFINNIYNFFDLDEVWQFLLFVIDVLAIIVFDIGLIIIPIAYHDSVKTMKNNHQIVLEYETNLNPTKSVCDKAEKYNEELKELYFADSVEDQKEYIDTELLWARFLNNTNARAESIIKE